MNRVDSLYPFPSSHFKKIWGDYFAGGAGASTGITCAVGEPAFFAVNHSREALEMYKQNHPNTTLYCEDIFDVDPIKICKDKEVWLLWASPDCTHHSRARGGKPISKRIRGLPWAIVRAAFKVKPDCIMFENVEEIQSWCPCITDENGNEYPDPTKKGETFDGFISIMTTGIDAGHHAFIECCEFLDIDPTSAEADRLIQGLGYKFEGRELVAADYGAPTIRNRFYGIFRCDGRDIVWPKPTHSKGGVNGLKPWRAAAEIIDWSLPCPSIFESKQEIKDKYGLRANRPLRPNTMRRIIRGVDKFTIKSGTPFIVECNHGGEGHVRNITEPVNTITAKYTGGLCDSVIAPFTATNTSNAVGTSVDSPVNTARTGGGGGQMLVAPSLIQYHTEQSEKVRGQAMDDPLQTVDSSNRYGLTSCQLVEYYGNAQDALSLREPVHTVTSKDREGLTVAHISKYFGGIVGIDAEQPLPTVTAIDHNALCCSHIAEFKGQDKGQAATTPLRTITASIGEFGAIKTTIVKYNKNIDLRFWPQIRDLLNEYCGYNLAHDEILLISINGSWYYIADIGLRMLTPRELYNAQGFLPDYHIEFSVNGKPYSRKAQVERVGNSVCPVMSEALVRANFPERCVEPFSSMEELEKRIAG